jgi:drug/metabolite transporter (DMT)-like permease
MSKKATYAEISIFLITIIWGLGFPITKIATSNGFGPNSIMVGRFLTAAILLFIVYFRRLKDINKSIIKYGVITGLFLFFGFYFQTMGNIHTTASKNGFITQLNIVFVPYLYYLFFKKKVDIFNIISVIIAISGLFILTYKSGDLSGFNLGDFYTLICAVMVAFNVVTASYFQKKYDFDPALFVFVNIITSLVLSLIALALFEKLPNVALVDYWPLLFLGILNTGLGFLVQGYALKYSLPTRISLIVTLESVFAAIGSVLIIKEVLSLEIVLGGLLIISAVLISELKPFNNKSIK